MANVLVKGRHEHVALELKQARLQEGVQCLHSLRLLLFRMVPLGLFDRRQVDLGKEAAERVDAQIQDTLQNALVLGRGSNVPYNETPQFIVERHGGKGLETGLDVRLGAAQKVTPEGQNIGLVLEHKGGQNEPHLFV